MATKVYRNGKTHTQYVRELRAKRPVVFLDAELRWRLKELAARNHRNFGAELDAAVDAWLAVEK